MTLKLHSPFTVNLLGKPRAATLEGRSYLVFPAVILREGVHHGSNGPTLYELEDIARFAPAWNHKPVIINHPKDAGGLFTSADDPAILNASKVGLVMASQMNGDRLSVELWLEKSRLETIEPRLVKMIERGIAVQLSTGLFADNEDKSGDWRGEKYNQIARNYRPDHLALLPDSVGACSVADGCMMITASEGVPLERMELLQSALDAVWNGKPLSGNCGCQKNKEKESMEITKEKKAKVDSLISANLWAETEREWLSSLEDAKLDKMVATNKQKEDEAKKLIEANKQKELEQKKAVVNSLIESKQFVEKDREWLNSLEEEKLGKLASILKKQVAEPPAEEKSVSAEEYIAKAPGAVREMLSHGLAAHQAERKRFTDIILSNKNNKFTKEDLADEGLFNVDRLRKMAALAIDTNQQQPSYQAPLYIGNAGAPDLVENEQPGLDLPSYTFGDKK